MIKASEQDLLDTFELIHGEMRGQCSCKVVYSEDDSSEVVGVACMKGGQEAWRSTLSEMAFDLTLMQYQKSRFPYV